MAKVPREAVEFARVLVRSFYQPEFVVLTDAVLRLNNYVAHHDLASRLRMQPKELRTTLAAMAQHRLMKSEKRQQKRINLRDERRPTRMVSTEFWYVPLVELIDTFVYRVHRITSEYQEQKRKHTQHAQYICTRCGTKYQLLDIVHQLAPNGVDFQCVKVGAFYARPALPCNGIIKEHDNSGMLKQMDQIHKLLQEQLRPLRERAQHCQSLEIPSHPLEGADEQTWGERVPETIGVNGEAVDDEGVKVPLQKKAKLDKPINSFKVPDDTPIPEKPSWFKESTNEDEEEWDDTDQQVLHTTNGTAAVFDGTATEDYYKKYLAEFGNAPEPEPVTHQAASNGAKAALASAPASAPADVIDIDGGDDLDETDNTGASSRANVPDVYVSVLGKQVKLSEVTHEMQEKMTADEYKTYYALAKQSNGDDDDDDDEFE